MTEFQSPLHLGGPLGLAGLAMLAGATGLFVMAGSNGAPRPVATITQTPHEAALAVPETPAPAAPPVEAEMRPTSGPDAAADPVLPASAETMEARPPAPIRVAQASAGGEEVVFIVRIKGEPEIDVISRNFKRDPAVADEAWVALQNRYPVLKDFRLAGASYSGEIKLAYRMPPGMEPTRAAVNDIRSRIMQVQSVSYADPDYVAQPGKDKPE
mgnify:CR=1 FL=1